jgi:hypothetical protein
MKIQGILDSLSKESFGYRKELSINTTVLINYFKSAFGSNYKESCYHSSDNLVIDSEIYSKIDSVIEGLSFKSFNENYSFGLVYEMMYKNAGYKFFTVSDNEDNLIAAFSLNCTDRFLGVECVGKDKELVLHFANIFRNISLPQVQRGHIFAIGSTREGLTLLDVGSAGKPLIKSNYSQAVIKDYEYAVEDLKSSSPLGRIVLLEGIPGTGKTHMVKSFLNDIPSAMFILVSPDLVPSLGNPEMLPLILDTRTNYSIEGPIIFVIEDADKCLVIRGADNMSSIQSLLNLGDGILGSCLNLKIIATTNAKKLEIEPALLRHGRLSKRIEVGPLSKEEAYKTFCNIKGIELHELSLDMETNSSLKNLFKSNNITLGDIYHYIMEEKFSNKS